MHSRTITFRISVPLKEWTKANALVSDVIVGSRPKWSFCEPRSTTSCRFKFASRILS